MAAQTTDVIAQFFDELAARKHEPRLEKTNGTLRFEVVNGSRTELFLLTVKKGDVAVSRRTGAADLVVRGERHLLERVFRGRANAMAAVLRGELMIIGFAPELLVLFQRLLPRPRDASRMGRRAGYTRRQR
jgi:putative sterol carrier protein